MELPDLLKIAVERKASDLHIKVGSPPVLRIDDKLVPLMEMPRLGQDAVVTMAASLMNAKQREKFKERSEIDLAYSMPGLGRFRANVFQQRGTVGLVLRVIPIKIQAISELNLPPVLEKIAMEPRGLILVTGTTGSGKSSTLASMIDYINSSRSGHILTIEDPIEFVHESKKCLVTHRQVGQHTETFKSGLRAALREDPDIVLIGELRDLETVAIAIETAETGHLVFGTLHTTTAASTVDRIIDQFPADRQAQIRVMLSESLRGVVSQTLCRKKGGGRVAAREILLTTPAISNLIREGKTFQIPSIIQTSRKFGMVTLNDALLDLVDRKVVESHEAYMKAVDKTSLVTALRARGHDVSFLGE